MNKKEQQIMDAISVAYSDPEVKKDETIREDLFKAAKKLTDGGDYRVISVHLNVAIERYTRRNNLKTPQSLIVLYELVRKEQMKYSGTIAATLVWWGR